jgi:hypothetical protein
MNNKTRNSYDVIGVNDGGSSASSVDDDNVSYDDSNVVTSSSDALDNESCRRTQDNIPPTQNGQSSRRVESITIATIPPASSNQQSQQQERGEFDRKVTTRGYHADDDSVVSSNHIKDNDLESAGNNIIPFPLTVSRSTAANNNNSINNNASNKSKTTRISKHQCYIIGIALLILTVGTVLILGYTIFNTDGDSTPFESNSADREIILGGNDNDDNEVGGGTSTTDDGVDDDDVFNNSNSNGGIIDILEPTKPIPGDISGYIAYHAIIQEISELSSFTDLDGPNVSQIGSTVSVSQKARDFLAFDDTLPVAVADEIGEGLPISVADEIGETEDEEEATTLLSRPYLGANTPAYRIVQRYATVVLYYATNGTEWTMSNLWLEPGVHECDWIGITCEDVVIPSFTLEDAINNPTELPHHSDGGVDTITERMVVSIDLPENNVSGYIPQELAGLPYLRRLGLWSNDLSGTLPSELGKVLNLTALILSDNSLIGSIPKRWSKLINLQRLEIQSNDMNFVVPESICSLTLSEGGGSLEVLVVDCLGADPEVTCSCCTRCY